MTNVFDNIIKPINQLGCREKPINWLTSEYEKKMQIIYIPKEKDKT